MTRINLVAPCSGMYSVYLAGVLRGLAYAAEENDIRVENIYALSTSAWTVPYFIAAGEDSRQLGCLEMVWLHRMCGRQFLDFLQPLKGGSIFKVRQIMRSVLCRGELQLNTEALFRSPTRLHVVITDVRTGQPLYISPERTSLFACLAASAARPFFHGPVEIGGTFGIDGSIADPLPIKRALSDKNQKVLVITTHGRGVWSTLCGLCTRYLCFYPAFMRSLVKSCCARAHEVEHEFQRDRRVFFLNNGTPLPLRTWIDTDAVRLARTYEQGKKDFHLRASDFIAWAQV